MPRTFILENPTCDYDLFRDSDAVFVQPDMIPRRLRELRAAPGAFCANPGMPWVGSGL